MQQASCLVAKQAVEFPQVLLKGPRLSMHAIELVVAVVQFEHGLTWYDS